MKKKEKIQVFDNHSFGTIFEFLKKSGQVDTFQEMAEIIGGSYTSMSTRRNEIGSIGNTLGNKLLNKFDFTGLTSIPVNNKEQTHEIVKSVMSRLDQLETDIQILKLAILKKNED